MRGKVLLPPYALPRFGITPAYAGKRSSFISSTNGCRDHPRVCGEKDLPAACTIWLMGSPPRMRGKASLIGVTLIAPGITPAYAGKRDSLCRLLSLLWDHPRVCGEKFHVFSVSMFYSGSPPRMRGKGNDCCTGRRLAGITPAYAGKRAMDALPSFPAGDHPRVCGEKSLTDSPQ